MNNLILFGKPLSGKGTLAKHLVENYGFFHISTGDLIREHQKLGTEIGKLADEVSDKGLYLPDEIVNKMVKQKVIELNNSKRIIFDGYPRTQQQAKELNRFMLQRKSPITHMIYLEVDFETCFSRAEKRAISDNRKDDSSREILYSRLKEYENKTLPLLEYFSGKIILNKFDASKEIQEVNNLFDQLFKEVLI